MREPIGLLLLSVDGAIRWANKDAGEVFGYTAEELCQMGLPLETESQGASGAFGPVTRGFREVLEGSALEKEGLARFRNKDRKRIGVHWKLWRVATSDGQPQILLSVWKGMRLAELGPTRYAFQESVESAEEAVFRCSLDGARFEVNQALAGLMGYRSVGALRGRSETVLERMFARPERLAEFTTSLSEAGRTGSFEAEFWRADRSRMWVVIFARTVYGGEGEPLYFEGRVNDITARKRAELALRRSEERFRALAETTGVIPFEYDPESQLFTYVGPQAQVLFGRFFSSGMSLKAWRSLLHPDDREIGAQMLSSPQLLTSVQHPEFRLVPLEQPARTIWVKEILQAGEPGLEGNKFRGFLLDVTESKRLEAEREQFQLKLRQLSAQSHNVREEERMIIAREIHDELGQALTFFKIELAWLSSRLAKTVDEEVRKPMEEKLVDLGKMLDSTMMTVRRILSALRPPLLDDLGLKAAIEYHVEEFTRRTGIRHELHISALENPPAPQATAIFRIFQEILTNVAKHAKASRVWVYASDADSVLKVSVEDNGKGISPEDVKQLKHFGILGMQERAWAIGGELEIYRRSEGGTRVTLKVPQHLTNSTQEEALQLVEGYSG
jgi:PAS domain S-box-containing protein